MTDQLTEQQKALIEQNIPLVAHIVRRLVTRFAATSDRDDLVQTGIMGLIEASCRFDASRGVAFSTFAGRRIEGAILDHLRRNDWAPRSVRVAARELDQAESRLTARRGECPDEETLAAELGIDAAGVARIRARVLAAVLESLDRPVGREDATTPYSETVPDRSTSVEGEIDERELRAYLRDAVALLPERHRIIIVGHFLEGRSMTDLGALLGVTQSRASQLKEDALRLMRQGLDAQYQEPPPEPPRRTRRQQQYTEQLASARPWRDRLVPA